MRALSEPHGADVQHIREKFAPDISDIEFIHALAAEGDWCIVSQDRLTRNPLEKEVLRRSRLTAFILAKGWANHKEWDKTWHLIRWWPRIMEQADLVTGGAAFEVPFRFSGKGQFKQIKL